MLYEQAELTGTVHQGVIVMDEGVELSEGQIVKVIIERPEAAASPPKPAITGTAESLSALTPLAQFMLSIAGTVDGLPPDFALNHDHYLYGAEKRQ